MLTSSDAFGVVTPRLQLLVGRAERATGSKMLAYASVARAVGTSASWVRKVLGNQPVAEPSWRVVTNLINEYEAACARWDEEAELQKQRFFALGRGAHEMDQSKTASVDLEKSGQVSRGRKARSSLVEMVDRERQ